MAHSISSLLNKLLAVCGDQKEIERQTKCEVWNCTVSFPLFLMIQIIVKNIECRKGFDTKVVQSKINLSTDLEETAL